MSRFFSRCIVALLPAVFLATVASVPCRAQAADSSDAQKKLEIALKSPTEIDAYDTPLDEVVDWLKKRHKIEIRVDPDAHEQLAQAGATPKKTVTRRLRAVSLERALQAVLGDLRLDYVAQDGVLRITTREKAAEFFITKTYPLRDLHDGGSAADWIAPITTLVEPKTWKQAGGLATIAAIPAEKPVALRVTHNQRAHFQIDALLQRLRRFAAARKEGEDAVFGLSPAEEKIEKALRSPTELELFETPLDEVVDLLKKGHKIEIQVDKEALDDVGIAADTLVTKSLKNISLRSALRIMLHELDLAYTIDDETLRITTPEVAQKTWSIRLYDIDGLVGRNEAVAGRAAEPLVALLRAVAAPLEDSSDLGTLTAIPQGPARALAVSGSLDFHRQVADVLDQLRHAAKKQTRVGAGEKKILDALKSPTDLELYETPLEEVVNLLKENHRIEIQIDKKALDDVGIATDTLVTKSLKGISLRSALRLMLHELDLTYVIEDEVLLIATPEVADAQLSTKTYPVDDVLAPARPGQPGLDAAGLKDVLIKSVGSGTRTDNGGAVVIPYALPTANVLVIRQCYAAHEDIAALLAALRRDAGPPPRPKLKPGERLIDPDAAERRIAAALKSPAEFDVTEVPLDKFVDLLKEKHGIEIQIDKKAFTDVGITADELLTAKVKGVTLRAALKKVLGDLDLEYVVADEVLQITTPADAAARFYAAVYPVDAAVEAKLTAGVTDGPDDKLVRKIVASIAPKSWRQADAAAAVAAIGPGGKKVLVVRQTYPVHEQIAEALGVLGIREEDRGVVFQPPRPKPLAPPPPAPLRAPAAPEREDLFK